MNCPIRVAFLAGAGLTLAASVTLACIIATDKCTFDGPIMVGNARGGAIPPAPFLAPTISDGYTMILRDPAGFPCANAGVQIELAGTGLKPHGQALPTDCANLRISGITNAQGEYTLFPAVVGFNTSAVPNVVIRWNNISLHTIRMPSVDLVPVGGGGQSSVNIADMNEFRLRFLDQAPYSNLDPSCDYATLGSSAGVVDVADLNVFRAEFLCGQPGGAVPPPCSRTECP